MIKNYFFLFLMVFGFRAFSQPMWQAVGNGSANSIEAMAVHDTLLLTGGYTPGVKIRAWNGTTWSDFGGASAPVTAMGFASKDGKLLVSSFFTNSTLSNKIIKVYDGSSWSNLGSSTAYDSIMDMGSGNYYTYMFVFKNKFYVAGQFDISNGFQQSNDMRSIAVYDSTISTFRSVGNQANKIPINISVITKAVEMGGKMYFAGNFNRTNTPSSEKYWGLLTWDGTTWDTLPYASYGVYDMDTLNGELYIMGYHQPGSGGYFNFMKYNGTTLTDLINGTNFYVLPQHKLWSKGGKLYAFYKKGSMDNEDIGYWNGTGFTKAALYTGSYSILVAEVYKNELYVAGQFSSLLVSSSPYIARLSLGSTGINKATASINSIYPNPCHEKLIIESAQPGNYRLLTLQGTEVVSGILGEGKNEVVTDKLNKGVYLLISTINGASSIQKLVLQ